MTKFEAFVNRNVEVTLLVVTAAFFAWQYI